MRPIPLVASIVSIVVGLSLTGTSCIKLERERPDGGTSIDTVAPDADTGGDVAGPDNRTGPDVAPPDVVADTAEPDGGQDSGNDLVEPPDVPTGCSEGCPASSDPCTSFFCNDSGVCEASWAEDGTNCGTGICNEAQCMAGQCLSLPGRAGCCETEQDCLGGAPVDPCVKHLCISNQCETSVVCVSCDDDSPCLEAAAQMGDCTTGTCDVAFGVCDFETTANCGGCTSQEDCADGNPCTFDICNSGTGACSYEETPDCCQVDGDCVEFSTNDCLVTQCVENTCTLQPSGLCQDICTDDSDCDDGDPCTDNLCVQDTCVYPFNTGLCPSSNACTGFGVTTADEAVLFAGMQAKIQGYAGVAFVTHQVTAQCGATPIVAEAGPVALKGSGSNHVLFTTDSEVDPDWECVGACEPSGMCNQPHAGGLYWAWGPVNPPEVYAPYLDDYPNPVIEVAGWCIAVTAEGLAGTYEGQFAADLPDGTQVQEFLEVYLTATANGLQISSDAPVLAEPSIITIDSDAGTVTIQYDSFNIVLTSSQNSLVGTVTGAGADGYMNLLKLD